MGSERARAWQLAAYGCALLCASAQPRAQARDVLQVCADPNNLPFSNARGEGFENALAALLARELRAELHYTFWPQHRGFARNTLGAGRCDVLLGVTAGTPRVRTTRPYYQSSFVFLTRRQSQLQLRSWDDPRLRQLRIGVHAVGDDDSAVPPAQLLARRGIHDNVHAYPIYGSYAQAVPARAPIDALLRGELDVVIVWGPLAGYFAQRAPRELVLSVVPESDDPRLPMTFPIALGVRPEDTALREALDAILERRAHEIQALLRRHGVPLVSAAASSAAGTGAEP